MSDKAHPVPSYSRYLDAILHYKFTYSNKRFVKIREGTVRFVSLHKESERIALHRKTWQYVCVESKRIYRGYTSL